MGTSSCHREDLVQLSLKELQYCPRGYGVASEREVKLIDTMAVVVVLVRPVCVWTVNLSGASQGGAPGLALTPSPTRHFILSSSARRHLSLSLSLWFSTISNVAGSNCLPHSFNLPNETRSCPIKCQRLRRVPRRRAVQSCLCAVRIQLGSLGQLAGWYLPVAASVSSSCCGFQVCGIM